MASSAPTSPLRRMLGVRFAELTDEVESFVASFVAETRDRARNDLAEQLNQSVRRLRQCGDREELAATLVDAAGAFAGAAALFRIEGGTAKGQRIRGVSEDAADRFLSVEIPMAEAAALRGAVDSRDPVIAVTTPAEVSARLVEFLRHPADGRASIYPIVVGEQVPALLYAWGGVQGALVELLAQVAAAAWLEPKPEQAPGLAVELVQRAADLVQIETPPTPAKPAWDALPPEEQQIHFRAQRFARVQAAEMRLYQAEAVQAGRSKRDLYAALRKPIDDARVKFHESFYKPCPSMVDYLHLEILRTLANDDPALLGKDYPGPLA